MENVELVTEALGGSRVIGRKLKSDGDFVSVVREGLPFQTVASVTKWLALSEDQVGSWVRISKRTAARRKSKHERLKAIESERLLRLVRLAAAATDVLGDRARAIRWLRRPNRSLGGEVPVNLLDTDIGFQNVMDVLRRVEYGVFS